MNTDQFINIGGLLYDKPTTLEALRNVESLRDYQNYAQSVFGFDGESLQNVMKMIDDRINEIGTTRDYQFQPAGTMPKTYYGGGQGKTLVKIKGKDGNYYYNYAGDAADQYIRYIMSKQKAIPAEENNIVPFYLNNSTPEQKKDPTDPTDPEKKKDPTDPEDPTKKKDPEDPANKENKVFTVDNGIDGNEIFLPYLVPYEHHYYSEDPKDQENYLKNFINYKTHLQETDTKAALHNFTEIYDKPDEMQNYYNTILSDVNGGQKTPALSDYLLGFFLHSKINNINSHPNDKFFRVSVGKNNKGDAPYYILPGQLNDTKDNDLQLGTITLNRQKGKDLGIIYKKRSINKILQDIEKYDGKDKADEYRKFLSTFSFKKQTPVTDENLDALKYSKGGSVEKMQYGDIVQSPEKPIAIIAGEADEKGPIPEGLTKEAAHKRRDRILAKNETVYHPETGLRWQDKARLAGTLADIGSLITNMTGVGAPASALIGLGGTTANSIADWTDDSVTFGEAFVGTGLGLMTDVASLVPELGAAAKSAKIVRNLGKLATVVGPIMAGMGLVQASDSMKRIVNGEDWTIEDLRDVLIGLQAVMGTAQGIKGAYRSFKDPKGFKETSDKIAVEVLDKTTQKNKNLIFEGEDATKLKKAYSEGKLNEEIANLTYNKNYEVQAPKQGFSKIENPELATDGSLKSKVKNLFTSSEVAAPFKKVLVDPKGNVIVKGRDSKIPWNNTDDAIYNISKNSEGDITQVTKGDLKTFKKDVKTEEDLNLNFDKVREKAKNLSESIPNDAKKAIQEYENTKTLTDNPFWDKKFNIGGKDWDYKKALKKTKLPEGTDGNTVAKALAKQLAEESVKKASKVIKGKSLPVQINGQTYNIDQSYVRTYDPKELMKELEIKKTGGQLDFNKMTKFVNKYGINS